MTAQLITLPLRLGFRAAKIVLSPVAHALGLSGDGQQAATSTSAEARPSSPPVRPREPVRWDDPAPARRAPQPRPRRRPQSRADVPEEPVHVSEEPVVVAEVADPGAEDGAGAQVTVAEPWEGYRTMKAGEVIDRLAAASPEEIAVVQLYEGMNRRRKTVLEAAAHSQRK